MTMKMSIKTFLRPSAEYTVEEPSQTFSKLRIIKNVAVMSTAFLFMFTGYDGLTMLQSTMNHEQGIGVASQSIIYAFFSMSTLLLPKYVIKKLGSKNALVLSMVCYLPYLASNFYPHWIVMIPSAVVLGTAASLVWGSQCAYLNDLSALYDAFAKYSTEESNSLRAEDGASHDVQLNYFRNTPLSKNIEPTESKDHAPIVISSSKDFSSESSPDVQNLSTPSTKTAESITARFFGIQGMAYLSSHVWSDLMVYYLLRNDNVQTYIYNESCICGASFCNVKSKCFEDNLYVPSKEVRNITTAVCMSLAVIAIILIIIFLDKLHKEEKVSFSVELLLATAKLAKQKTCLLLTPLCYCVGMIQGFYIGDFTKSYIGCAWGTYHVGLVSVCYGITCALSSIMSGWLVRIMGRPPIFFAAYIVNVVADILLLVWHPTASTPFMFFLIAGMWGVSNGVFWSQIQALVGVLYKSEEEAAFAGFFFWCTVGSCISYGYSNYLCNSVKIYAIVAVATLGILGYLTVERSLCRKRHEG